MVGIAAQAPDGLSISLTRVNGRTGCVACLEGTPQNAWAFHVEDGEIRRVYAVVNPEKLPDLSDGEGEARRGGPGDGSTGGGRRSRPPARRRRGA